MVVNRDNEITSFVPKPWWQVHALIEKEGVRFRAGWVPVEQYCDEESVASILRLPGRWDSCVSSRAGLRYWR
jgi:DNA topoisomerase IA